MPVCFESSIIELIYLIELLMRDQQIDGIFHLRTKESIIQKLKVRLEEMSSIMVKERIID